MAIVAIATPSRLQVPSTLQTRTRRKRCRYGKRGRTLSKTVRQRNAEAGRPWWQPSRSPRKIKPPRAAELSAVLSEDLAESELKRTKAEQKRRRRAARRQREHLNALREETVEVRLLQPELREWAAHELAVLEDPWVLEEQIEDLARDSEIGDHGLAATVESFHLQALGQLAAA